MTRPVLARSPGRSPLPRLRRRGAARWAARIIAPAAALSLWACASAPPPASPEPPAAPAPAAESQATSAAPADVDGTTAALERAESDLQRALAQASTPSLNAKPEKTPRDFDDSKNAEQRSGDPCQDACRALGSMRRSAEHLCGLTGDADARCETAKARVSRADERVRTSCPACPR
jgi:hypothetical protein